MIFLEISSYSSLVVALIATFSAMTLDCMDEQTFNRTYAKDLFFKKINKTTSTCFCCLVAISHIGLAIAHKMIHNAILISC